MDGQGILCFKSSLSKSYREYRELARSGVDEIREIRQASRGSAIYGRAEARRSRDFGHGTAGDICLSFACGSFEGRFRRQDPYYRRICASLNRSDPSASTPASTCTDSAQVEGAPSLAVLPYRKYAVGTTTMLS